MISSRAKGGVSGYFPFLLFFSIAILYALWTGAVREDYLITLRASKNLAMGHGLVFQVGERVQTFTSPLQVLALAFFSFVTGNRSDEAGLWLYRIAPPGRWGWRGSSSPAS